MSFLRKRYIGLLLVVGVLLCCFALYLKLNSSDSDKVQVNLSEKNVNDIKQSAGLKFENLFLGMIVGDTMQLVPKAKLYVKNTDLKWEIENESIPGVVSVKDGYVTALKEGTAVVKVENINNPADFAACPVTVARNDKKNLAPLPPLGWNSWNSFAKDKINEVIIKDVINAIVETGMKDAGYEYVVIDGGWRDNKLGADGALMPHPVRFKNGIKPLADYAHSKGLKFGLHAVPGLADATDDPIGSGLKEAKHLKQFVEWGVDFVKWDWCGGYNNLEAANFENTYKRMKYFMDNSGIDILFSANPWRYRFWVGDVCNMWRTTGDILIPRNMGKKDPGGMWDLPGKGILGIADVNNETAFAAGPGSWNDPDMLIVGIGNLSYEEAKSHFSLWSMMASPIFAGNDPRKMTAQEKEIYLNKELIQVNQDALGVQGSKTTVNGEYEIWTKPLVDGMAVMLLNRSEQASDITVNWEDIGYKPGEAIELRDLWEHKDMGSFIGSYAANVPSHGVKVIKINKKSSLKYTTSIENTDGFSILYRGSWNKDNTLRGISAATSSTPGDYMEFQFYGQEIELYAVEGANSGMIDIYIDNKLEMTWDGYSENTASKLAYKNDRLERKQHKLKVVVKGEKNSKAAGVLFGLDYINCTFYNPN